MHNPGRLVDVQSIDNHQIFNASIILSGEVICTQRGEVILIMHQYAHIHNSKTNYLKMKSMTNLSKF